MSTDILYFPALVLVIPQQGLERAPTLIPDTVLPIYSCHGLVYPGAQYLEQVLKR